MTSTYRDPITCPECGCFLSKHDSECSQWTEPFISREQLHQYVIVTQTKYLVYAPSLKRFMLTSGLRRVEAARTLGWQSILGFVRNVSDDHAYLVDLIENLQRETSRPKKKQMRYGN